MPSLGLIWSTSNLYMLTLLIFSKYGGHDLQTSATNNNFQLCTNYLISYMWHGAPGIFIHTLWLKQIVSFFYKLRPVAYCIFY